MIQHHKALSLTLLILAAKPADADEVTFIADAITQYLEHWTDERKADLYALLAERVVKQMTFNEMLAAVSHCLWKNEEWLHHG